MPCFTEADNLLGLELSPHKLVTGGDRRISHGVALAIQAATFLKSGTDIEAAFCNIVLTWCYQVMKMKGLRICSDHFSIVVLNNIAGRCIKNASLTIRQGDKFSIEMFTYGMNPVLVYLEKFLQGIPILQLPVQGPVQCTVSSASPSTT